MQVFVSYKADHLDKVIQRATLANSPEEVRKIHASIEAGDRVWASWVENHGGSVVSSGNGEGKLQVEAEYVHEVPKLREQYAGAVDTSVSVGIGARMDDAEKALKAASMSGDKWMLYGPEVEEVLAEEEGLSKADAENSTFYVPVASKAGEPHAPDNTPAEQPEAPEAPATEEAPPQDLHEQLGQMATSQAQQADQQQQQQQAQGQEAQESQGLKDQVLSALKVFQSRKEELEAVAKQDPELYKSLVTMVQSMIAMAREVFGGGEEQQQEVQKSEKVETSPESSFPEGKALDKKAEDMSATDLGLRHLHPKHRKELLSKKNAKDMSDYIGQNEQAISNHVYGPDNDYLVCDQASSLLGEALDHHKIPYHHIVGESDTGDSHAWIQLHDGTVLDPTNQGTHGGKAIAKAALEAGKTGRHDVNLPVGSTKEPHGQGTRDAGKIKIQKPDGKVVWRSVRSGIIQAADGTPTSSRHPNQE